MKLVLAEKPSVGRTLAKALGCFNRNDGYIEGNGYIVTWALGHLVELVQPATYGSQYKRWSYATLPILPEELKIEPIDNVKDQYRVVKSLLERSDIEMFIIATDAGREGELVARWILKLSSYEGEVKRLWISSQTDSAIKEGFENLKPGDEYLNLYHAAESRAAADWYVGMNVTRALTTHFDAKMSAGRVQTPCLALMCDRETEIENFKGNFYWTIKADFGLFSASYYTEDETIRINSEQLTNELISKLDKKTGKIESIEEVEKVEHSPLAYDLTELQRDANLTLGFSAKKTLDVLQKLYEYHKIVTYPRTDSRYITHDIVETIPSRLKALEATVFAPKARYLANDHMHIDKDRFVRDELVSDHHAIIPTDQKVNLNRLSDDEKSLWQLIVVRFLEVLEDDYVYKTETVQINVEGCRFKTRLTTPIKQGFRDIARIVGLRTENSLNNEESSYVASLHEGEKVTIKDVKSRRTSTDSPKRYNDATLLSAMEHAGRFVEDLTIKKNLSAGLGTPATRADIIEKLINNHYIDRSDTNELIPTARGREIVRLAPDLLKSPELTGQWEERLSNIAKGIEDSEVFIQDIKQVTRDLVKKVGQSTDSFTPNFGESKKCPFCDSLMMSVEDELGRTHFVCQKLSCSYEEMMVKRRVPLTQQEVDEYKAKLPNKKKVVVSGKKKIVVKKLKPTSVTNQNTGSTSNVKVAAAASSSASYFSKLGAKPTVSIPGRKTIAKPTTSISKIPSYKYETVIEVVHESKKNRRYNSRNNNRNNNSFVENKIWDNNKKQHSYDGGSEGGGTFADFIKVSEKRKNRRDKKNR
jgi:DNA topoisomerase-3